uniref:Uncharacterized protein n=1 Tax=Oryza nivara TaxID=4536 RepID=A0A0E0FH69_ORYNI
MREVGGGARCGRRLRKGRLQRRRGGPRSAAVAAAEGEVSGGCGGEGRDHHDLCITIPRDLTV